MLRRPFLVVLAGLAGVLLAGGLAWALLGPAGPGERRVPPPIDVPARSITVAPDGPQDGPATDPRPQDPAPGTDVVPPPPLPDDDDDDDDDGPGDDDDGPDVDDDGDD
ncbi:hypothetical protein [Blastococcus sp. SYSU DS0533]